MSDKASSTPESVARSTRALFEELLPNESVVHEEEGWIDTRHEGFMVRPPRRRGNWFTAPFLWLIDTPPEAFMVTRRLGRVGEIPIVGARKEPTTAPQLKVVDSVYEPLNPVDRDITTVRLMQASFRTYISRDADDNGYEAGIRFDLLEVGVPSEVSMNLRRYNDEPHSLSFIGVGEFLAEHGFSTDIRTNNPLLLAKTCIAAASRE